MDSHDPGYVPLHQGDEAVEHTLAITIHPDGGESNGLVNHWVVDALYENAVNAGVSFIFEATADDLLTDDNGTVCGIHATGRKGESYAIQARKVILACGGFGGNYEMLKAHSDMEKPIYLGPTSNRGWGIEAGESVGAKTAYATLPDIEGYNSMAYLYTGGRAITGLPDTLVKLGRGRLLGLPNVVWLIFVLYIICWFLLQKTTFGRKICATGDNAESARLSGINVRRTKLIVFAMSGFFAALSGLVYMSRLNSGQPIAGQSYEMYAIAAAVIGGASFVKGGIGDIVGTLIGAVFIAGLQNGLTILNVDTYWQQVCMGLVVLLAVGLDRLRKTLV